MTNTEKITLIKLCVKDLDEAIKERERLTKNGAYYPGEIPAHCSKEAIERRIKTLRMDLLRMRDEL